MIAIAILVTVISLIFAPGVNAQTLPPGGAFDVDWYGDGCSQARVSACNVADPTIQVLVYCNGVRVGICGAGGYSPFYSRGMFTDTITLVNTNVLSSVQVTALSVECASFGGSGDPPFPTPTPIALMTPQPVSSGGFSTQGAPLPLPSFGGDLSDPNSPVNLWIGYAEDIINLINGGNLLYIIGAVAGAGAVLSWAIQQVRQPKSWGD